jgi:two-component system, OmpR family, response regulator PhoP
MGTFEDIRVRVYIVEGDDALRQTLVVSLAHAGFLVSAFPDAACFDQAFAAVPCDMAVIDSALADGGSLSMISHLRDHPRTGIVALCGAGSTESRVRSLESGADACLVKPIDVNALAAQLRAINRRLTAAHHATSPEVQKTWALKEGGWVLCDPAGNNLHLTTAERAVLLCLLGMRGNPASRQDLLSSLGGNPRYADPHRIDVLINRLRNKAHALNMRLPLHSVRSKGYMLIMEQMTAPPMDDRRSSPAQDSLGRVHFRPPKSEVRVGLSAQSE